MPAVFKISNATAFLSAALFMFIYATPAFSSEVLRLEAGRERIALEKYADVLHDPGRKLSIGEAASPEMAGQFSPLKDNHVELTNATPSYWLRFRLSGIPDAEGETPASGWILEVRPSFSIILDKVDLFVPKAESRGVRSYSRFSTGAMRSAQPGDIPSRYFLFELPSGAAGGGYCYLRLESSMEVSVQLFIRQAMNLRHRDIINFFAFGIIFGILLAMVFYNFFVFINLKDATYLYYILYVGSALVWQFHVQGHSKMFLGQHPGRDLVFLWISVSAMLFWGAVFTISFLSLKKSMPRMYKVLAALAALNIVTMAAGVLHLHRAAFGLSHISGLVLPVLVILAAALRLRQGFKPARFVLTAWSLLAAGGVVFALMGLKVLPVSFWSINGVAIGMTMEALLLSLALADRIRKLRADRDYYRRTQQRYLELSVTDGLTGLYNKRYLQSRLEIEVEHARRMNLPLSLVLLDLDDFKVVNDLHGHGTGDIVLKGLSNTIRACTREGDMACRFGGEEFVVIMPGTRRVDAYNTAERIRNRFSALSFKSGESVSFSVTISLGVTELDDKDNGDTLIDRADKGMYEAKKLGKNRSVAV